MSKHTSAIERSGISTPETLAQQVHQGNTPGSADLRWIGDTIGLGDKPSEISVESTTIKGWSAYMSLAEALQEIGRFDAHSRIRILSGIQSCRNKLHSDDQVAVKMHFPTAFVRSAALDGQSRAGYRAFNAWHIDLALRANNGGWNEPSCVLEAIDQLPAADQRDFIAAMGALISYENSFHGSINAEMFDPAATIAEQSLSHDEQETLA